MVRLPSRSRLSSGLDTLVEAGKAPGLQYVAVDANGPLVAYATGLADIRRARPMQPTMTLMAYSMSKTITAVAVLQLVERGRLDLQAPVIRYFADSPYGGDVTVGELVTHTGGLPNPIPLRWVHPAAAHDGFDEDAALAAVLRAHPRLRHAPGTRYAYSNVGYWILGKVVERASGLRFVDYIARHILEPLDIAPTELAYSVADRDNHAAGYLEKYSAMNLLKRWLLDESLLGGYEGRWLRIRDHHPNGAAFGGMVGSAASFGRFLQDQLQPRSLLLGDSARRLLYAPQRTRTGKTVPMTYGWHVGESRGATFFFKEGGGGGFHCLMRLYPSRGIGSVVMANATGFDVAGCLDTADALLFDEGEPTRPSLDQQSV